MWWPCTIGADEEGLAGGANLSYVGMEQHGFEKETRRVVFLAGSFVWDAPTRERLAYRREGEEGPPLEALEAAEDEEVDDDIHDEGEIYHGEGGDAPSGTLAVGTAVKARFQGGAKFCAGVIHAARTDGTYDVYYEDHVLEEGVPGDMIEVVELDDSVANELAEGGDVAATSTNEFFDTFVSSLTTGPAFARLTAEQQAIASEKVRKLRPHFEAELEALREKRGWGATVTGADIKEMLPRVMARAQSAA